MIDYVQCKKIQESFGSPFYLFDKNEFILNFENIKESFSEIYNKFIIGYSYKTNYTPYLCKLINEMGGWAEVVSRMEYDLAIETGQDPKTIIFNGPLKTYEDIFIAIANNSLINLDSFYEIDHLRRVAQLKRDSLIYIGLRVNMNLDDQEGGSHVQEGLHVGRFGFPPESLGEVLAQLKEIPNVRINSLHGHTSSTSRSVWIYRRITETLCNLAAEFFPDTIQYINVGGGIFGKTTADMGLGITPSFDDYAAAIGGAMMKSEWVRQKKPFLILEPGVAMVANTFSFITSIVEIKHIRGKTLAVVDGSVFNTKPSMHKRNNPFIVVRKERESKENQILSVTGSTCMEKDYLLSDISADIQKGDFLQINNTGAYTLVMTPPFINLAPPIVAREGKEIILIRRKQEFKDVFSSYIF